MPTCASQNCITQIHPVRSPILGNECGIRRGRKLDCPHLSKPKNEKKAQKINFSKPLVHFKIQKLKMLFKKIIFNQKPISPLIIAKKSHPYGDLLKKQKKSFSSFLYEIKPPFLYSYIALSDFNITYFFPIGNFQETKCNMRLWH